MKEKKQIFNAANLADKESPEVLDQNRAKSFISSVIDNDLKNKRRNDMRRFLWIGTAISAAACISLVLFLFGPKSDSTMKEIWGNPHEIRQNTKIHAAVEVADSLNLQDSSSVEIQVIKE